MWPGSWDGADRGRESTCVLGMLVRRQLRIGRFQVNWWCFVARRIGIGHFSEGRPLMQSSATWRAIGLSSADVGSDRVPILESAQPVMGDSANGCGLIWSTGHCLDGLGIFAFGEDMCPDGDRQVVSQHFHLRSKHGFARNSHAHRLAGAVGVG